MTPGADLAPTLVGQRVRPTTDERWRTISPMRGAGV
jgi:hypothetical protein